LRSIFSLIFIFELIYFNRKIALLKEVSWLEVNGSLDMKYLDPGVKYKLEFVVYLKPDAFGWKDTPAYIMVKPGRQSKYIWKNADLTRMGDSNVIPSTSPLEFTVPLDHAADDKLNFGLFEIWKGSWKGGLVIQNVIISKVSEV
jgi:Phloem protein 2